MSACPDIENCFHSKAQKLSYVAEVSAGSSGTVARQFRAPLTRAQFPASRYAPPAVALGVGVFLLASGLTWAHLLLFVLCAAAGMLWFRSVRAGDDRAARIARSYHEGDLRHCGGCDQVLYRRDSAKADGSRYTSVPRSRFPAWMVRQGARYPADPPSEPGGGA